jgi:hypothetical protein
LWKFLCSLLGTKNSEDASNLRWKCVKTLPSNQGVNTLPPTAGSLSTYYVQKCQNGRHFEFVGAQLEFIDSRIIGNVFKIFIVTDNESISIM